MYMKIDTHTAVKRLIASGLSEQQSEAMVEVSLINQYSQEQDSIKDELKLIKADIANLDNRITEVKNELKSDITRTKSELKLDISKSKNKIIPLFLMNTGVMLSTVCILAVIIKLLVTYGYF